MAPTSSSTFGVDDALDEKLLWVEDASSSQIASDQGSQSRRSPKNKTNVFAYSMLAGCLFFGLFWDPYLLNSRGCLSRAMGRWCGHHTHGWSTESLSRSVASPSTIAWFPCPDDTFFQCSFLTVPMNYLAPLPNETVSLALRKYPATAPLSERRGSLLGNPGGPGGSGTRFVETSARSLSVITEGRFDIIGWDPRGVNQTVPSVHCFHQPEYGVMQEYSQQLLGYPFEGRALSEAAELSLVEKIDAHDRATTLACSQHGDIPMLKAVSTAFTARDMKSIAEALGEPGGRVQFWGFSYGTMLGATFAGMFPELSHRLVLDGVCDAARYTGDVLDYGVSRLAHHHQIWDGFLSRCLDAGPEGCALASPPNQTLSSLKERLSDFLSTLSLHPLPVVLRNSDFETPPEIIAGVLTASDVIGTIYSSFYAPRTWPSLAEGLAQAEAGNGTYLFHRAHAPSFSLKNQNKNVFHRHLSKVSAGIEDDAIACPHGPSFKDRNDVMNTSFVAEYYRMMGNLSIVGESAASWTRCRHWKIDPFEAYRGPWSLEDGLKKTEHPVLFIGNALGDPATPVVSARKMAHRFGDFASNGSASLIEQQTFGHCSSAVKSTCTAKLIRDYLVDGIMPDFGTKCEPDSYDYFPVSSAEVTNDGTELGAALESLTETMSHWYAD